MNFLLAYFVSFLMYFFFEVIVYFLLPAAFGIHRSLTNGEVQSVIILFSFYGLYLFNWMLLYIVTSSDNYSRIIE